MKAKKNNIIKKPRLNSKIYLAYTHREEALICEVYVYYKSKKDFFVSRGKKEFEWADIDFPIDYDDGWIRWFKTLNEAKNYFYNRFPTHKIEFEEDTKRREWNALW